ncbi:MAG TPA: hypothetical protein VKR80_00815 [Candidatus Limnocylindria bacterium]|nr:hypothetical protein [Candidatus Limnocylindria bacterium]
MITTETGVYLQFYDEGESVEKELPPLGPFELLIIRHNRIIGDREQVEHDLMGLGSVERWLEAELELRRALGDEPGGVRRSYMRIRAPRGDIIVRFYDYAGDEPPKVPELGPFYALTIGKREVRADDKLLAIRATDMSPWTLTDAVRPGIAGINKADFSVFSLSVREPHPATAAPPAPASNRQEPVPPAATVVMPVAPEPAPLPQEAFIERRKVQREIYVARPEPKQQESLTPADVNLILRVDKLKQQELAEQLMIERLRKEQRASPELALRPGAPETTPMRFQPPVRERELVGTAEVEEEGEQSFSAGILQLLWSGRLVIVTALLILAGVSAYGYLKPRALTANEPPPLTFAAMGQKIAGPGWTYQVTSVERAPRLGTVPPQTGGYLIVHVTVQRTDQSVPPLETSEFQLIDANGARSFALAAGSEVYQGTGLVWATKYADNAFVQDHLAFDVSPTAKDLILLIRSPNVEVRLPDP